MLSERIIHLCVNLRYGREEMCHDIGGYDFFEQVTICLLTIYDTRRLCLIVAWEAIWYSNSITNEEITTDPEVVFHNSDFRTQFEQSIYHKW